MEIYDRVLDAIEHDEPISFLKFGDGEMYCMMGVQGRNCDRDTYTMKLRQGLIQSFRYVVNETDNVYPGRWHTGNGSAVLETLTDKKPKWAYYHTLIFEGNDSDAKKVAILKQIQTSPRKKILVCNPLLVKAKDLLHASDVVYVGLNNWFDTQYERVFEAVKKAIGDEDGHHIVVTCAGMGSKVLLASLRQIYPKGIYLDYGSGLDLLCTKRDTRGCPFSYDYLETLCKDILPNNWNDPIFDPIYTAATMRLGLHIPK